MLFDTDYKGFIKLEQLEWMIYGNKTIVKIFIVDEIGKYGLVYGLCGKKLFYQLFI